MSNNQRRNVKFGLYAYTYIKNESEESALHIFTLDDASINKHKILYLVF